MAETIPADVEIEVVIARSQASLSNLVRPFVAIFPDPDNWDDYGRNFFATMLISPAVGEVVELHMRMMFQARSRSYGVFMELLTRFGEVFPIERVDTPFVTLLPATDHYRKVIEVLGFDMGVSALRKIHDAVVIKTESDDPHLLALVDSEDFHFGALRNGSAYDALRRGGRFFRKELPVLVEDVAANFGFSARLKSADNPYTLRFDFDRGSIFRDRTSVLIGKNGVGKTQLLKAIVDSFHSNRSGGSAPARFMPTLRPSRVLVFSSVPSDPFPRTLGAWHGIDYEYFPVNAQAENGVDPLLASLVACRKSDDRIPLGEDGSKTRMDVIKDALGPIGLWFRLYLPVRPRVEGAELPHVIQIDDLRYVWLGRGLNERDSIRLVQQIDWSRRAVVLNEGMEVRQLSSGEYAMLRFAAQAAAAIEQGSLLLLDEPETHLHPNYVSDMMEILDTLLQSTGSIAIVATHSAYVVREAPRHRVNVLSLNDRQISIDNPRMQTFGATIDSISQFVFGDTSISHRYQKTLTQFADTVGRDLGLPKVIETYGSQLNSESLSFIARRLAEAPSQNDEPEAR